MSTVSEPVTVVPDRDREKPALARLPPVFENVRVSPAVFKATCDQSNH